MGGVRGEQVSTQRGWMPRTEWKNNKKILSGNKFNDRRVADIIPQGIPNKKFKHDRTCDRLHAMRRGPCAMHPRQLGYCRPRGEHSRGEWQVSSFAACIEWTVHLEASNARQKTMSASSRMGFLRHHKRLLICDRHPHHHAGQMSPERYITRIKIEICIGPNVLSDDVGIPQPRVCQTEQGIAVSDPAVAAQGRAREI